MSVINQMLRDLDARAASEQERSGLPRQLRPLPPTPRDGRQAWRYLALFVAALALGAILSHSSWSPWQRGERRNPAHLEALPPLAVPSGDTLPPSSSPPLEEATASEPRAEEAIRLELTLSSLPRGSRPMSPDEGSPPKPENASSATAARASPTKTLPSSGQLQLGVKMTPEERDQPAAAIEEGKTSIAVGPAALSSQRTVETATRAGLQALQQGDPHTAEEHFRRALAADPQATAPRQALLAALTAMQRMHEARFLAEEGLRLSPQRADWALIAARLQYEAGEHQTALATLERHAAYAGGIADYQGFLAFLLEKVGRVQEAAEHYRLAASLKPGEGRWWYGLGVTREMLGDHEGARESFRQAVASGNLPQALAAIAEKKAK